MSCFVFVYIIYTLYYVYIICIYYVKTSVIFDVIMVCISKFMCFMVPDGNML